MTSSAGGDSAAPGDGVRDAPAAEPTVSVVMIFLNAAAYIEEAIESVRGQSFVDWELLLVDDGSTDASSAIARGYASSEPERIRYLTHPGGVNRGMSASRNRGIYAARGRYIAFLDSDDVWLPDRLREHVDLLTAFPAAEMSYGPTVYWYSWTGVAEDAERDFEGPLGVPAGRLMPVPKLLELYLTSDGGYLPGICSLTVRRDAAIRLGGFEEAFKGTYEDQVFLSKTALHLPIVVSARALDLYRQHDQSCCHLAIRTGDYHPDRPHPARWRYLDWLDGYLSAQGITDERLVRPLATSLWPYRHPWRYRIFAAFEALRSFDFRELTFVYLDKRPVGRQVIRIVRSVKRRLSLSA